MITVVRFFSLLIVGLSLSGMAFAAQPLPLDQAFVLSATLQEQSVQLDWQIAPGDYLYQDRLLITPAKNNQLTIGPIIKPLGELKNSSILGQYRAYTRHVRVIIPFKAAATGIVALTVHYQGCSTQGFCYSPVEKTVQFDLASKQIAHVDISGQAVAEHSFKNANLLMIAMTFIGLGFLLAFTPCVLPMLPILSSIIIGHHKKHGSARAIGLSISYVLGMAIAYAVAGVLTAWVGSQIQTVLQAPWVIILLSGLFVLLALFLWGVITFTVRGGWQTRLTAWSNRFPRGSYLGVFAMGALSSLVISPCVSPALVGVLAYIAKAGDMARGAWALFSLGIGMGIPLLLVGASCHRWLPKAGRWMKWVEKIAGLMLLGVAVMLLSRIIPVSAAASHFPFSVVTRMSDFDAALRSAQDEKKQVILDFYADWCVECVKMQRNVFSLIHDKKVLSEFVFLQDNITDNTDFDRALMKRFNVIAPPTILFFSSNGQEQLAMRLIGGVDLNQWLHHLKKIEGKSRADAVSAQ